MKYLLDTCALIYFLMGQKEKVPDKILSLFNQIDKSFFVSTVSLWEIVIKFGIGKLVLKDKPNLWVLDEIKKAGFKILPMDPVHIFNTVDLPLHHKDPFDRMLISQSSIENLIILSPDHIFSQYHISTIW